MKHPFRAYMYLAVTWMQWSNWHRIRSGLSSLAYIHSQWLPLMQLCNLQKRRFRCKTESFLGQNEACYARFASYLPSGTSSRTGCNSIWRSLEWQTKKLLFVSLIPFGHGFWLPADRILIRYCGILTSKSIVQPDNAFMVVGCNMGKHSTLRVNHALLARTPWVSVSLHWDGTNANGMYCTPIAIAVANINSASASTRTCIGYMPTLSGMGRRFTSTKKARDIRHYIRQKCIGSILSVLEEGARRGVRCTLRSTDGSLITFLHLICLNRVCCMFK